MERKTIKKLFTAKHEGVELIEILIGLAVILLVAPGFEDLISTFITAFGTNLNNLSITNLFS